MSELEETDELNKKTERQSSPHGLLAKRGCCLFVVLTFDVKEEVYATFIQPFRSPYDSPCPWF